MIISEYYLGVDGGGTKTEAVIVDKDCRVLGSGRADGSNVHNFPIDSAMEHIRLATNAAVANMYKNHEISMSSGFKASCIGIAGLDGPEDRDKIAHFFTDSPLVHWPIHSEKILITNDGLIGLKSGTDKQWGVCLVSSTGSNCYGLNQAGKEAIAGDWGHLLGDQGSSYAMGLKIIRIIMKEYDGRRPTTILTEKTLSYLKMKTISELVAFMYSGQTPVKAIASLAHLYDDPDVSENEDLLKIVRSCGQELILAYQSVIQRLELVSDAFPVVLIGGLFNLTEKLTNPVTARIKEMSPQAEIILPSEIPAIGAAKLAINPDSPQRYPETTLTTIDA